MAQFLLARALRFEQRVAVLETAGLPLTDARTVGGPIYNHQCTSVLPFKRLLVLLNVELITSLARRARFELAQHLKCPNALAVRPLIA